MKTFLLCCTIARFHNLIMIILSLYIYVDNGSVKVCKHELGREFVQTSAKEACMGYGAKIAVFDWLWTVTHAYEYLTGPRTEGGSETDPIDQTDFPLVDRMVPTGDSRPIGPTHSVRMAMPCQGFLLYILYVFGVGRETHNFITDVMARGKVGI
jgi:hypothetical protein